ncbi:oxaloacetate decarboxylase subunit gamma [Testudinibacter sp. TR-2022]|uniref:oxaloacetate decarboxylase subunit gamma n=1 Tax=Testudinibacter sp. TR-2022 TaxID=2585029 RepID=UPI00111BB272|nr:oxaloacetate decarboxylase subunit gamma [Testudinibacter sp. TR-2022]TNH06206.1 oxaloacetate decarboxylase subunit gamma [Pasteurellaceae bacterium Phil11]TNH20607.1 oxaloacetate decarboxylase subunit gamma [Testudinibacter sp. TR-2022]
MTAAELMAEGIALMVSGMGFVLLFLCILILAIRLMSYLVNRFFPEPMSIKPHLSAPKQANLTLSTAQEDLDVLRPVIVAAIAHHRRQR